MHVAAVITSGALFALRGAGTWRALRWPMFTPLRYLSYTIDTVLLTAALMLATLLHQYPFVHAWLTVKVLLLVGYILLGTSRSSARAHAPRVPGASSRRSSLYLFIASVARAHHPLGIFARRDASRQSVHTSTNRVIVALIDVPTDLDQGCMHERPIPRLEDAQMKKWLVIDRRGRTARAACGRAGRPRPPARPVGHRRLAQG